MRAAFLACLPRVSHEGIEESLSLRGFSLSVSRFEASTLIFFFFFPRTISDLLGSMLGIRCIFVLHQVAKIDM